MKKFISGLVVGIMVASLPVAFAMVGSPFKDIDASHWAYGALVNVYDMGLIKGYPDNTFRPNSNVTRAELAVIMDRMNQYNEKTFVKKNTQVVSNLSSVTLSPMKLSLQYPSNWGSATGLKSYPSYEGTGQGYGFYFTAFPNGSSDMPLGIAYYSKDFSAMGEGIEEMFAPDVAPKSCAELKAYDSDGFKSFANITNCEVVQHDGFTVVVMDFPKPAPNTMSVGERHSALLYTNDPVYPYVIATASPDSDVTLKDLKDLFLSVAQIS